jgi:3',5'-cyclic AMP phosphodiesterase CpdA
LEVNAASLLFGLGKRVSIRYNLPMNDSLVRIVHFSDVHLTAKSLGWRRRDFFTKRLSGWVNIKLLGRGRRFRHAPEAVTAMLKGVRAKPFDAMVFSGDATKLGFAAEFDRAGQFLCVNDTTLAPTVAVPGNHDYYIPEAASAGHFETTFAPWQIGERVDGHPYPFARKFGHVWLIAVNSATPNSFALDASGEIGSEQLARLKTLCDKLGDGLRVIVTHYPLCTETGALERKLRILRDHQDAIALAKECGVSLWLHGHIHKAFVRGETAAIPFPVICAGSATQTDRWSYHEYTIQGRHLLGVRFRFDLRADRFQEVDRFSLILPGS